MNSHRPLVLVGTDVGSKGRRRSYHFCYEDYVSALTQKGCAVVLSPVQNEEALKTLLDTVAGVLIPGGDDLCFPDPLPEETPIDSRRQKMDIILLEGALERNLPFLGVCYGMQLLQHVYGGELIRHLPEAANHTHGHHHLILPKGQGRNWWGEIPWEQPSNHHQGVCRAAPGLDVLALAPDGVIEALADPKRLFVAGVQWHVEKRRTLADERILERFVMAIS